MPTNLPPEYFKIEEQYREAKSPAEKAALIEEMLRVIPKHKGTDRLRADLRRKLAKLKEAAQARKKTSRQESAYSIVREGAGQAVLVGAPNVGKSALLAALTNATPEVAEYSRTTWVPTPGMMPVENIQVQLIDTPSLSREFVEPQLIHLIRRADLLLLVVDLQTFPIEQLEEALEVLKAHRIMPRQWASKYDLTDRRLTLIPTLLVVNKVDHANWDADYEVLGELLRSDDVWDGPMVPVSATTQYHVEQFKRAVFDGLEIVRVYAKPPGKTPDFSAPFVLRKGGTVEEFAGKVHQDFLENMKAARVWGKSAQYDGQMVSREHILCDGDVVELRM